MFSYSNKSTSRLNKKILSPILNIESRTKPTGIAQLEVSLVCTDLLYVWKRIIN